MNKLSAIPWRGQVTFQWDNADEIRFELNHQSQLYIYSGNLLKQQSTSRDVAPLLSFFRAKYSLLLLINVSCLAVKHQYQLL
jgi:hypothetical protein